MPPLGVPDEEAHFLEAYGLSNTLLGKEVKQDNYVLLDEADKDSIIYLHDISSISEWYDSFEIKKATGNIKEADMQSTVGSKAPWTYLPSAIGISIARLLNIHGNLLLLMGRLFNLLFEAGITALAIRILPYAKTYISVLGLVPEVIYLYGSYSYDGINLCLCILIVSYFLYLNAQEKKIKLHQLGILCLLLLLMIPIKLIYVFMALLVVLLPVRKLNLNRKQLMIGTIVGLAVILLIGINIIPVIKNAVGFNNNMTADEDLDAWNTLFMMLFVLFGYLVFVKRDFTGNLKIRLVFSFLGIFTPVVTAFPLALGYSGINVPNRCEFVLDMSIIITAFNLAFTLGILIAKRIKEQLKEIVVLIMTVAASVCLMLDGFGAQDIKITEISKELQDGIYEDHYYSCKEFYKSLETYEKGSDVIISKEDFPTDIENTQNIILSKDPTMWINTAVAQYYGFHTISVLK